MNARDLNVIKTLHFEIPQGMIYCSVSVNVLKGQTSPYLPDFQTSYNNFRKVDATSGFKSKSQNENLSTSSTTSKVYLPSKIVYMNK